MRKTFTSFKSVLLMAALFSFNTAFAESGTETVKEASIGGSNNPVEGRSYTVAGTYNAGGGSSQVGDMISKGFKMRTGSDGDRCVFTVNSGYTITSLEGDGISNYAMADDVEGTVNVTVTKVEVDGAEVSFVGGEFPAKGSDYSGNLSITGISAKESIAIYFDNSKSKGKQVNFAYTINWEREDATQPTIKVTPESITLAPGANYKLKGKVDPETFTCVWSSENGGVATVNEEGLVTAVAPGSTKVTLAWDSNAEVCASSTINVSDFDIMQYEMKWGWNFASMGDVSLEIGADAVGNIWNEGNKKPNAVYFCTNSGLENLAVQAVLSGGKGWSIVDGQGLTLATGAGRCAAVGNLKAGQVVIVNYSGDNFFTGSKEDASRKDDGATKTPLNEGIGTAIYQMNEDGLLGFELDRGAYVSTIFIYEPQGGIPNAIETMKAQVADDVIYNLAGQRVKQALKGIFIQNGKIMVK